MSVASDEKLAIQQEEIREALVVHCKLSSEQIEQVDAAAKALRLTFGDAAVHIGIVTQNELNKTVDFLNVTADGRDSYVIETALRRLKPARDLVVRPREVVSPSRELILAHDPNNPRSERIRALRTELSLLGDTPGQTNVMALVSPCGGEGRSLLAAELAIAYSQLRRRTLLIDADLRKPSQHILFPSDNTWGLTQTLVLGSADRLFGVEGLPELSLLTSGPAAPNPLELLSDGRFGRLVADFCSKFDHILIDTPPVSRYADGLTIATTAGRALVLSRAAVTTRKDMKDMMRRLVSTQARVMGAVISHY
jgi:receptor protein-tyrosine kinase